MFVKAFSQAFHDPVEVDLHSSGVVPYGPDASEIQTESGQRRYYSQHPPEVVRKALRVYAGILSGREESHISLPFSSSNVLPEPQSIGSSCLDLTKEQIEIAEETTPVDVDGNIQIDAMQTRVRTLSYDGDRERAAARKQAEEEARKKPQIGQTIPGKGVYMGVWTPKDRSGNSLGKSFAVYAAPEDLTDDSGQRTLLTFQDTAKHLTTKRNWHGYDGGNFVNDTALYNALRSSLYHGEWFIPTRDLLAGSDLDGNKGVYSDNLIASKDKGDFKEKLVTSGSGSNKNYPEYYWSLAEHRDDSYYVWCARPADGDVDYSLKDLYRVSCRPVRLEALNI